MKEMEYIRRKNSPKKLLQKVACTPMFTAMLQTIARIWKQPKCPSTDEWIKKMWLVGLLL